jgi:hypothetical protein
MRYGAPTGGRLIIEQVTVGEDRTVSVRARDALLPYFSSATEGT